MKIVFNISWLLICLAGWAFPAFAQQTGTVDFPEVGLSFTIPSGWVGQVTGESFIIGHPTQPGFLLLSGHDAKTVQEMRATAAEGLADEANGVFLQPAGALENKGDKGVGGEFAGMIGGQQVRAYLIGLLNPYGQGVLIMSAVSASEWSPQYRQLAEQVANSMRFSKAVTPPVAAQGGTVAQWKQRLSNSRLTFMESYNSIDYSNPDITTGGGYSNKEVIDLCGQGYFNYASSSFVGVTGGANVSGSASGRGQGAGAWSIREEANGNKMLVLTFYSGEVYEYTLSYPGEKMHLNGKRYFHTWTGEHAPNCQ